MEFWNLVEVVGYGCLLALAAYWRHYRETAAAEEELRRSPSLDADDV
jgi:hypothetical protein